MLNSKKRRIILNTFIIIFMFVAFMGCGLQNKNNNLSKKSSSQKLILGTCADYPPYEFHKIKDGKDEIIGFDIEIAKEIAKDLGYELEIKDMDFEGLIPSLKTGKVDILIAGMTPDDEKKKEVDFSKIYYRAKQNIIIRKKDKDKFKSLNDLKGKKVGAQMASLQEKIVKNDIVGSEVVSLGKVTDLILSLKTKKIDAMVVEGPVAKAYVKNNKELMISNITINKYDDGSAIAIKKGNTKLLNSVNKTVDRLIDNKDIDKLVDVASEELVGGFMENIKGFIGTYIPYFIKGSGVTVAISLITVIFSALFGTVFAMMKLSKRKLVKGLAVTLIELVRGTPLLVQVYIFFFGIPQLLQQMGYDMPQLQIGKTNITNIVLVIIPLIINSTAYVAEIIRSGIESIDKGQMEAARCLGLTYKMSMKHIIIPQAIKNILPALGNEFITIIKESAIVFVVGIHEIMFVAKTASGTTFMVFTPYLTAAAMYFILTFGISKLLGILERRMKISD